MVGEGIGPYMGLSSSSVVHIWQIDYFAKCSNMSLELHSKAFLFMGVGWGWQRVPSFIIGLIGGVLG